MTEGQKVQTAILPGYQVPDVWLVIFNKLKNLALRRRPSSIQLRYSDCDGFMESGGPDLLVGAGVLLF